MRKEEDYIKTGVFGGNQVGKTTAVLKIAKSIYSPRDKVIFYTDQNPPALASIQRLSNIQQLSKFKAGIIKYYNYKDPMQGLKEIMELCYTGQFNGGIDVGGALILDDCKNYCKAQNEGPVTQFMANHRTYFWDLYFVSHDYKQMPLYIRERLEAAIVFKVMKNMTVKDFEDLGYLDPEALYEAYTKVMMHPDMRANQFIDFKQFFKKFREKNLR